MMYRKSICSFLFFYLTTTTIYVNSVYIIYNLNIESIYMQKYVHTNISISSHSTHRLFPNLTQSSNPKWGSRAKSRWTDASSGTNHHQMWATTAQSAFSQQRLGPSTKESLWGKMQRCQRNGVLRIQGPKFPKSLKKKPLLLIESQAWFQKACCLVIGGPSKFHPNN